MTEIEQFIADWIDGQCRKFRAELNNGEWYCTETCDHAAGVYHCDQADG